MEKIRHIEKLQELENDKEAYEEYKQNLIDGIKNRQIILSVEIYNRIMYLLSVVEQMFRAGKSSQEIHYCVTKHMNELFSNQDKPELEEKSKDVSKRSGSTGRKSRIRRLPDGSTRTD